MSPTMKEVDQQMLKMLQDSDPEALRKKLNIIMPYDAGEIPEPEHCFGCKKLLPAGTNVWMAGDRTFCDKCSRDSDLGWQLFDQTMFRLDQCLRAMKDIREDADGQIDWAKKEGLADG